MKIISLHFPKAGGSSLRSQFHQLLQDKLLLDYDHHPLGPNAAHTVDELPPSVRLVHGHFHAARYDQVRDAFRFTFLREPIENLLSIYYFWETRPDDGSNPWHSMFLREKPTVEEFAKKYIPVQRLMSETFFGGYDMSRFDFVGFFENRLIDIPKLAEMIGVPLDANHHINRTESGWERRAAVKDDRKLMARLSTLLADDLSFFERQRAIRN